MASNIALPLLTIESMAIGIAASYAVGVGLLDIEPTYAWWNMLKYSNNADVMIGIIKSCIYGGIIAIVGCYKGLNCKVGAEGVGRATTEAVVYASITILITNFFLTMVLQQICVILGL
jgi:phospholipid/cholesterol/gamma-HCH transport system permease protein